MTRPRIMVTLDTGEELRRGVPFPTVYMKAAYARSIELAGGTPICAAPSGDSTITDDLASMMDGLVVTGGAFDIDPASYGRAARSDVRLDARKPLRTAFEWRLVEIALERKIPIFGVCGGMQLLNVVLGGTLHQDIAAELENALEHEQPTSPATPHHAIKLTPGSALARAYGREAAAVNSTHHQAVERLGEGLVSLAESEDGVIEALGRPDDLSLIGVQWHPELLDDDLSRCLYRGLVEAAARRR